jgi:protein ImuA
MGAATRQQEVLEELRRSIRRIERRPARRAGVLGCGRPEVEALLPGGGFPLGALSSLQGGPASGKTAVALSALREAQAGGGLAAFVDGRGELYPPAALALGVDLARLLIVRPGLTRPGAGPAGRDPAGRDRADRERGVVLPGLWAAEVLLGSGAFSAVAVDIPLRALSASRAEPLLRRLRAAAEKGGAAGLLLVAPGSPSIPATARLDLDAVRLRAPLRAAGEGAHGGLAGEEPEEAGRVA